jgi:hypothetical protein
MRRAFLIAAGALVALAAGCVNYDERMELNPDGSGVVRMHIAVAEQVINPAGAPKVEKEDELLPMPRKEMIADIEKQGFTVKSLRAESTGGLRHFYIVIAFKNVADLQKSELFCGRTASMTREGGKLSFRSQIAMSEKTLTDRAGGTKAPEAPKPEPPKDAPGPSPKAPREEPGKSPAGKEGKKDEPRVSVIKQLEMRFGKERVRQMFGAYSVSFSVEVAGATLLRTNGVNHRDAAAVWETPLDKHIDTWPTIAM